MCERETETELFHLSKRSFGISESVASGEERREKREDLRRVKPACNAFKSLQLRPLRAEGGKKREECAYWPEAVQLYIDKIHTQMLPLE